MVFCPKMAQQSALWFDKTTHSKGFISFTKITKIIIIKSITLLNKYVF